MSQHYNDKHKPTGREFIDCLIKFRNTSEQMCLKCPKRWHDFTLLPFMTHTTDALSCVIMANEYHVIENKNVSEENKLNHYKKLLKNFEKRIELLTQAIGKLKMVSVLFNCIEVKLNYEKEEFNKIKSKDYIANTKCIIGMLNSKPNTKKDVQLLVELSEIKNENNKESYQTTLQ